MGTPGARFFGGESGAGGEPLWRVGPLGITRMPSNQVDSLRGAILRYQSRAIGAAQVIEELIALARCRGSVCRSEQLDLAEEEPAF